MFTQCSRMKNHGQIVIRSLHYNALVSCLLLSQCCLKGLDKAEEAPGLVLNNKGTKPYGPNSLTPCGEGFAGQTTAHKRLLFSFGARIIYGRTTHWKRGLEWYKCVLWSCSIRSLTTRRTTRKETQDNDRPYLAIQVHVAIGLCLGHPVPMRCVFSCPCTCFSLPCIL